MARSSTTSHGPACSTCFVRSPFARARINGIDTAAALALPGVHAVFVAADLNPDAKEAWYATQGKDIPDTPRPPMAQGEARFVGDPVALVVAESRYIAEDAAESVEIDFEPLPAVADFTLAEHSDVLVHERYPDNIAGQMAGAPPDEATFASAAHVVSETIYQHSYAPVPIETRGMVVEWAAASGELTIWASTQSPHELRAFCARLLGLPEQRIRVIMRDTGGGFGQKVVPLREDMCMMLAARKVPAALKWIEDRRENLMSAGQARHTRGTAKMAFDADGDILAVDIDYSQDVGAYPTPWPFTTAAAIGMFFPGPYRVPKASFSMKTLFSNTSGLAAYRGPWQYESVAREILLDVAARTMAIDPVELRRRNLLRRDEMPYANPTWHAVRPCRACGDLRAGGEDPRPRGFPPRTARCVGAGPLPRPGHVRLYRTHCGRDGLLRDRGRDDPHRADGQGQCLRGRRLDRKQPRNHGHSVDDASTGATAAAAN